MRCGFCHEEGHNKVGCLRRNAFLSKVSAASSAKNIKKGNSETTQKGSTRPTASPTAEHPHVRVSILNPRRRGSLIVGREVARSSVTITTAQLLDERNQRIRANNVVSVNEDLNPISTQQSSTSRKSKEKVGS